MSFIRRATAVVQLGIPVGEIPAEEYKIITVLVAVRVLLQLTTDVLQLWIPVEDIAAEEYKIIIGCCGNIVSADYCCSAHYGYNTCWRNTRGGKTPFVLQLLHGE